MNIICCIKQVPDTNEVQLDPVTGTLKREGIPSIINHDDLRGIEAALQIKEAVGGKITVLSMGPPQADIALREALAMGCDEAILLSDRAFGGSDTWATSATIASAIKKLDFDLIITGRQAIDGDTAQVGPQIAEHLDIPQVSYAEEISVEDGKLIIKRQFEDRHHIIEASTPLLITTLTELNKPRYMTVGGIFDAYSGNALKSWSLNDIRYTVDQSSLGLKGSPTKVKKSFNKKAKPAGKKYEVDTDEAVKIIVDKLVEKHII